MHFSYPKQVLILIIPVFYAKRLVKRFTTNAYTNMILLPCVFLQTSPMHLKPRASCVSYLNPVRRTLTSPRVVPSYSNLSLHIISYLTMTIVPHRCASYPTPLLRVALTDLTHKSWHAPTYPYSYLYIVSFHYTYHLLFQLS